MKELIDFILKTGQPLAYIESDKSMRFKNIDHNDLQTIYKYANKEKELEIIVPKELRGKISNHDNIDKNIYNEIYVGETKL